MKPTKKRKPKKDLPSFDFIYERQDAINKRLNEIEKLIQAHAIGVQNVYDEFKKITQGLDPDNVEKLCNKIKYTKTQVKTLEFKMAQWYADVHDLHEWAKDMGFESTIEEKK